MVGRTLPIIAVNWSGHMTTRASVMDVVATGSAEVTFTATDECGEITTNATLTIVDTSPPSIDMVATDMVVESNGQGNVPELNTWLNLHGGAQAADACSQVIWSNNFSSMSDECGTTGSASVIFTVTDENDKC